MQTARLNVSTNQEAFDKVCWHLSTMTTRAAGPEGDCQYRTSSGDSCAAGVLIDDDQLEIIRENAEKMGYMSDNWSITKAFNHFGLHGGGIDADLIFHLQRIHDANSNWGPDGFEGWSMLREVAEMYNLDATAATSAEEKRDLLVQAALDTVVNATEAPYPVEGERWSGEKFVAVGPRERNGVRQVIVEKQGGGYGVGSTREGEEGLVTETHFDRFSDAMREFAGKCPVRQPGNVRSFTKRNMVAHPEWPEGWFEEFVSIHHTGIDLREVVVTYDSLADEYRRYDLDSAYWDRLWTGHTKGATPI